MPWRESSPSNYTKLRIGPMEKTQGNDVSDITTLIGGLSFAEKAQITLEWAAQISSRYACGSLVHPVFG